MEKEFDLQEYMTRGVERIVTDAMKATLKNPRESAYMIKFASAARAASKKRATAEKEGVHISISTHMEELNPVHFHRTQI